ncbi:MAG: ABC transporter permease [Armatimonadota bacterium]|nr:ABC transporter permease [Armatimonadota bacterium]
MPPSVLSPPMRREVVLLLILAVVAAAMHALSGIFLSARNLLDMGRHGVEVGLIALPMTLIIITRGIDLSVGSMVGLAAMTLGLCWEAATAHGLGAAVPVAVGCALGVGAMAGAVNGVLVARAGLPPLIVTLATLAVYRGLAMGLSRARAIHGYPASFYTLGQGDILGIPSQVLLFALLSVAVGVALGGTAWGRTIYAIGCNEEAARFSALPVTRTKLMLYVGSGLFSALAAVVYVSRVSTARADAGTGFELDAIAAVVLGGTSISGGEGGVAGTVIALLIISALRNGLFLARYPAEVQPVIIGGVLILSILMDRLARRSQVA